MARSSNWRINRSSLMPVEGAMALKALQKVAGAAGLPSGFKIRLATTEHSSGVDFDTKEVFIGAGRLFKEAPIPAEEMDVLVGLTLHEVGHQQIESDKVWSTLTTGTTGTLYTNSQEQMIFQKFTNIGEDIAIESRLRANLNLADYGKALENWGISQMTKNVDPNKLLDLWIEYALGHKAGAMTNLSPEMNEGMAQLVALTGWLRHDQSYIDRVMAYRRYWTSLRDIVLNPPKPKPQPQNQDAKADADIGQGSESQSSNSEQSTPTPEKQSEPQKESPKEESPKDSKTNGEQEELEDEPDEEQEADDSERPIESDEPEDEDEEEAETELDRPLATAPEDAIDEELAAAIEDAIQSESEDITKLVALEFMENKIDCTIRYPIIRSRETKSPLIKPDPALCKRLERIMTIRKRLQARIMHGERYGQIDKRHLHRVGTDERIFSLKYKFPDGFPNCHILIDLSGSMTGRQADEVLEAAGALQVLVNAEVWCYHSDGDTVNLVRIDSGKLVHQFHPGGSTPSGLAIVGVSLGMRSGGLIIHLTDGEHNVGQMPWNAHWILKGHGIQLINLIWGHSTRAYSYEGMSWKQLSGLAEFPEALYQILVDQAKLGKIGGK